MGGTPDETRRLYLGRYNGLIGDRIALDAVQEWTVAHNASTVAANRTNHNWHLHTHHFQVVEASADHAYGDYDLGDWRDTVNVPPGGWVKVRRRCAWLS